MPNTAMAAAGPPDHRGCYRQRPNQGHHTTPAAIFDIIFVANTTSAPTNDPYVRPSGAPGLYSTTRALTTPVSLRYGK